MMRPRRGAFTPTPGTTSGTAEISSDTGTAILHDTTAEVKAITSPALGFSFCVLRGPKSGLYDGLHNGSAAPKTGKPI
jgi:hypothetical protein